MTFTNSLREYIRNFFQRSSPIFERYAIAGDQFEIYYWSAQLRDMCHRPLQHLSWKLSENALNPFSLYVLPSTALHTNDCMISVRKNFLMEVQQNYKHENDVETVTDTIHSRCHEDYFYLIDSENRYAIWVYNEHLPFHFWYFVAPFNQFFQAVISLLQGQMTHSAAIATGNTGLLFTGSSGVGKSTTTLMAIQAGYKYIGEDYCILKLQKDQLVAHSIFNTIKLTENTAAHFPDFFQYKGVELKDSWPPKKAYFLAEHDHFQITRSAEIKAICSLSIGQQKSPKLSVEPAKEAMKSLAFSTIWYNPIHTSQSVKNFTQFLTKATLYHLQLGSDFKDNLNCIKELFHEHS